MNFAAKPQNNNLIMGKNGSLRLMAMVLSCSFVATLSAVYHSSNYITTDELALLALKEHVIHVPQNLLATNWSTSTHVCYWIGVTCSSISNNQRVTTLNLAGMGLTGTIPPHLGNLSFLAKLDIHNNNFHGSIPKELANLSRLTHIDFYENGFCGEIPSWFGSFTQLQFLSLYGNNFTGSIPSSIFNISSLQVIELGLNKLSSHLSADTFDQLPLLQSIGLSNCQVSGRIPISLFKCKHLEEMYFADNQLEGSVPIEIGNLTSLQKINLRNNNLEGVIPWNIKSLTSLAWLDLRSNGFTGRIPTDLPPSVLWFFVSENQLVGEMAPSICNLSSLRGIDLSLNNLSGTIPECLRNLSSLQGIDLSLNDLGGTIPECLGNLSSSVLHVSLYKNNFHGEIAGNLFPKNCSLRSFYINSNQLEGPIPQSLVNCKGLNVLNVGNNHLNDTFPWWLGNLKNLQIVVLRSNRLHGQINVDSQVLKISFSQLRIIDFSDNDFNGCLPSKLFEILYAIINIREDEEEDEAKYMEYNDTGGYWDETLSLKTKGLDVEYTKILTTLTVIDFSNNRFSGELPETLGRLKSLRVLNMSYNNLRGPIPSSLSNLSKLESLDLSSNKLQGTISAQLTNLISLEVLNLSWNNLTGLIPRGNQFDTFTNDSYNGNTGLCGLPLLKSCIQGGNLKPHKKFDDTKRELNWKFSILMGYGCGVVFGLSMGYVIFATAKPWRIVKMIERLQEKVVGRV